MALNIRNQTVNRLADELAARLKTSKTEAVRRALEAELRRTGQNIPLIERIRPIQARIMSRPAAGLEADKAFYDDLGGNL
jgi:antitoxin VapB